MPTRSAKLSEWLPYWLDNVIKPRRKLSTFGKYEAHVRLYLVPLLGAKRLEGLGAADVRRFLVRLERETTAATAKESHRVLRSALTSACREELITRNVAKLVEPLRTDDRELRPWSLDETLDFLAASRGDPLYAAFVLAIAMGPRRGEIIGLRWSDFAGPTLASTTASSTSVSRPSAVAASSTTTIPRAAAVVSSRCPRSASRCHRMRQAAARARAGETWQESGYVLTTRAELFTDVRRGGHPCRGRRPAPGSGASAGRAAAVGALRILRRLLGGRGEQLGATILRTISPALDTAASQESLTRLHDHRVDTRRALLRREPWTVSITHISTSITWTVRPALFLPLAHRQGIQVPTRAIDFKPHATD